MLSCLGKGYLFIYSFDLFGSLYSDKVKSIGFMSPYEAAADTMQLSKLYRSPR